MKKIMNNKGNDEICLSRGILEILLLRGGPPPLQEKKKKEQAALFQLQEFMRFLENQTHTHTSQKSKKKL